MGLLIEGVVLAHVVVACAHVGLHSESVKTDLVSKHADSFDGVVVASQFRLAELVLGLRFRMLPRRQLKLGRRSRHNLGRFLKVSPFLGAVFAGHVGRHTFVAIDLSPGSDVVAQMNLPSRIELRRQNLIMIELRGAVLPHNLVKVGRAHATWRMEKCPGNVLALGVLLICSVQAFRLRPWPLHSHARGSCPALISTADSLA